MNNQEIFDKVATHLLTQNAKSTNGLGHCQYRGMYGLQCAVGCLIPDELYNSRMDSIISNISCEEIYSLIGVPHESFDVIASLQRLHDYTPVESWKEGLRTMARTFNLDSSSLDKFA